MTSTTQRGDLQTKIWKIANEVRGSVDGWDFKHFVLGALFYRFISENFTNYIEGGEYISLYFVSNCMNIRLQIKLLTHTANNRAYGF